MNPLEPFETAIGWLLAVLYSVIPNLGISIILLTCAVMAVLLPLTAKQTRSMIAMQRMATSCFFATLQSLPSFFFFFYIFIHSSCLADRWAWALRVG